MNNNRATTIQSYKRFERKNAFFSFIIMYVLCKLKLYIARIETKRRRYASIRCTLTTSHGNIPYVNRGGTCTDSVRCSTVGR